MSVCQDRLGILGADTFDINILDHKSHTSLSTIITSRVVVGQSGGGSGSSSKTRQFELRDSCGWMGNLTGASHTQSSSASAVL